MLTNLPNLLTMFRIAILPVFVALFFVPGATAVWACVWLFALSSITDFFDGYLARKMGQSSPLGAFLDPIADKLSVGIILMLVIAFGRLEGIWIIPAIIIMAREIFVSGLREFLGPYKITMPVSKLAKWKTTLQLLALGALILGGAVHGQPCQELGDQCKTAAESWIHVVGLTALWASAVLTCITGWDYLRVGLKHMD